jgi:hypothetical protein
MASHRSQDNRTSHLEQAHLPRAGFIEGRRLYLWIERVHSGKFSEEGEHLREDSARRVEETARLTAQNLKANHYRQ